MSAPYQCPRCQRVFLRSWFWRGRCSDCRGPLEPWMPAALAERAAAGEHVARDDLPGVSLADGAQVWKVVPRSGMLRRGGPLIEEPSTHHVGLLSGEVFALERREQMVRAGVRITGARAALDYVRFLYGYHVHRFFHEQPRYAELSPKFFVGWDRYSLDHLSRQAIVPSAVKVSDGSFAIVRHVVSVESLPEAFDAPRPLGEVIRLEETVQADGRYHCEASEVSAAEALDYRGVERPGRFGGVTIRRLRPIVISGRPLRVGGGEVTAELRRGEWG